MERTGMVVGLPGITSIAIAVPACFEMKEYHAQCTEFSKKLETWLREQDVKLVIAIPTVYSLLATICEELVHDAAVLTEAESGMVQ